MIYVLSGENTYAMSREADRIIASFVHDHGVDSVDTYQAEAVLPRDLPQLLQGQSLFSSVKLIVLRDPSADKTLWEALGDFLEKTSDVDLLIVDTKPDKRTRTFKWLQKHAQAAEYRSLDEREAAQWVEREAKRHGVACSPDMARFLVSHSGTDQWRLTNDLDKLALANKQVTRELIRDLIEPQPQASAFELLDAITAGKHSEAERLLEMIRLYEDPYRFLGLIISQLYALAACVVAEGKSSQQIAKDAGIHPFVAQKSLVLARTTSRDKLQHMLEVVEECDLSLKTSGADPWMSISAAIGRM